ncbi:MAG TPA: M48 family peptidase [Chloroflexi bacterium]|nr:M48 family peptidase [Chloroflexota bacterium]
MGDHGRRNISIMATEQTGQSEPSATVTLDAERQQKAKEYARIQRRLMLVDLAVGGLYLAVWLISGWYLSLRDWIGTVTQAPALALLLYGILFAAPYLALDQLLSFYSSYILPHRYGQSNQRLGSWIGDQIKGLLLSGLLGLGLLEIIYWLLRSAPEWWWLYSAGVILFFTVILSSLGPVLIAPLFYRFTPLEDDELTQRLIALARRAGTNVRGVYRFDMSRRTKSANAALVGLGATRRIVLGDTLLENFTADEIETVLAHELGHHVHRDIVLGIVINTALTLISFWAAHRALLWSVERLHLTGLADPASLPILILVTGVLGLIAMPLGNAYSRWRERLADRYALEATGKPEAFASAMTRLANQNLADADPERWAVLLLYSHPPIRERVAFARSYAEAHNN